MATTMVGKVLRDLYAEHGKLTPSLVLEAAREEDHPLHHRFEWDDTEAAEQWRLRQAASLIRSVRITYIGSTEEVRSVRAWVSVPGEEEARVYRPEAEIGSDPILRNWSLVEMRSEWIRLRQKFERYQEFWALVQTDAAEMGRTEGSAA